MNAITIVKYVLGVIDIIIMLALIIVVLVQYKDENGASGTIVGASSGNFYEKNKGRTKEGRLNRATILLMIIFAVLTLVLSVLYAM
jgi:preprotein translocase subunit SecG